MCLKMQIVFVFVIFFLPFCSVQDMSLVLTSKGNITDTIYVGSKIHYELKIYYPMGVIYNSQVEIYVSRNKTKMLLVVNNCFCSKITSGIIYGGSLTWAFKSFSATILNNQCSTPILNVTSTKTGLYAVYEWDMYVPNSNSLKNGSTYYVTASILFNNGANIVSSQYAYILILDNYYESTVTPVINIIAPKSIQLGASEAIQMDIYIPYPVTNLTVNITNLYAASDAHIIRQKASVSSVGSSYNFYPLQIVPSSMCLDDLCAIFMGDLVNTGVRDNSPIEESRISILSILSAEANTAMVNKVFNLSISVSMGNSFSKIQNFLVRLISYITKTTLHPSTMTTSLYTSKIEAYKPFYIYHFIYGYNDSETQYTLQMETQNMSYSICTVDYDFTTKNMPYLMPATPQLFSSSVATISDLLKWDLGVFRRFGTTNTNDYIAMKIVLEPLPQYINKTAWFTSYLNYTGGLTPNITKNLYINDVPIPTAILPNAIKPTLILNQISMTNWPTSLIVFNGRTVNLQSVITMYIPSFNYVSLISISLQSLNSQVQIYKYIFYYAGTYMPCLKKSKIVYNVTKSANTLESDIHTIDFGIVSTFNSPFLNLGNSTQIFLEAILTIPRNLNLTDNTKLSFINKLYVNGSYFTNKTITFTLNNTYPPLQQVLSTYTNPLVISIYPRYVTAAPRSIVTFKILIAFTFSSCGYLKINATGFSSFISIQSLQMTSIGINYGVFPADYQFPTQYIQKGSSRNIAANIDLGYMMNNAQTLRVGGGSDDQNMFLEVKVLMGDFLNDEMLRIDATLFNFTSNYSATIRSQRMSNSSADVAFIFTCNETNEDGTVNIRSLLYHKENSTCELYNVTLAFYLPRFLTFVSLDNNFIGQIVSESTNNKLRIWLEHLYFTDVIQLNITLKITVESDGQDSISDNLMSTLIAYEMTYSLKYQENYKNQTALQSIKLNIQYQSNQANQTTQKNIYQKISLATGRTSFVDTLTDIFLCNQIESLPSISKCAQTSDCMTWADISYTSLDIVGYLNTTNQLLGIIRSYAINEAILGIQNSSVVSYDKGKTWANVPFRSAELMMINQDYFPARSYQTNDVNMTMNFQKEALYANKFGIIKQSNDMKMISDWFQCCP